MRVADFVIKFLEEKNIKNVFTVSGGGSIFLCDALVKKNDYVLVITNKQLLLLLKVF